MKISPTLCKLRLPASVVLLLILTTTSFAQISLREALDYDADGKADFAVIRPTTSYLYILKSSNGLPIYQSLPLVTPGPKSVDIPTPGDYDGDNKGDIAFWRDSNGTFYYLRSQNNTIGSYQFGTSGDEPVARDWDADNITDFAVVRRSNGFMYWYIQGSTSGFHAVQFGVDTDSPVPGDYNGDAKFERAVYRRYVTPDPNNLGYYHSAFYVLDSSNSMTTVHFGRSDDYAAPGDYDGDGKTDYALVRDVSVFNTHPTDLEWNIKLSAGGQKSVNFGLKTVAASPCSFTDFLVQNDYDGDGITDIAVWRSSNGTFYFLKSSSQTVEMQAVQWGACGDFPIAIYDTH